MARPRFVDLDQLAKIGSCTTPILADLAVTEDKIDTGAVTGEKIADGSISSVKIDVSGLDSSALADGSITAIKLNADVFGNGLTPNGVTNAIDINVDNVTLEIAGDVLKVKDGGITLTQINIDGNLSFNNHQATLFRVENLTSDPIAGNPGRLIFRSDTLELRVDDGTSFTSIGSGGAGGHTIQDEGSSLPQRTNLDFVGAGVTVTDDAGNDKTVVSIPGGGTGTFAKDLFTVVNPANKVFSLLNSPISNSELVLWNGLHLRPGSSNDYTISGNQVTLNAGVTLTINDELLVAYSY